MQCAQHVTVDANAVTKKHVRISSFSNCVQMCNASGAVAPNKIAGIRGCYVNAHSLTFDSSTKMARDAAMQSRYLFHCHSFDSIRCFVSQNANG